jgi:hypothetical protein
VKADRYHELVERTVDRQGVNCRLVRLAEDDEDIVDVEIVVSPQQFRERDVEAAGTVVQKTSYWMIPARRLMATAFPCPPRPGDRLIIETATDTDATVIGEVHTVDEVGVGLARGEIVRWDLGTTGIQV